MCAPTRVLDSCSAGSRRSNKDDHSLAGKRIDFTYNNAGQFEKITRFADATGTNRAVNSFYKYDEMGRLTQLTHTNDASAPTSGFGSGAISGHQYTYDAASRISSRNNLWRTGSTTQFEGAINYTYDNTDQLRGEDRQWSGSVDATYSYDINGNRTMTGYTTGTNNQLTSDGTYNYVYDAEGNRVRRTKIADGTFTNYYFDHRNRLVRVDDVDPLAGQGETWVSVGRLNPATDRQVGPAG